MFTPSNSESLHHPLSTGHDYSTTQAYLQADFHILNLTTRRAVKTQNTVNMVVLEILEETKLFGRNGHRYMEDNIKKAQGRVYR